MRLPAKAASLLVVPVLLAAQPPVTATADDTALRKLVADYMDARERIDPKAVEALFTPDADQLVSSGEWRKGREEVVKGTQASSRAASGKRTITVESIRMLSADIALIDGRYELAGADGGATRRMWTTILAARTPGGWRIAAIRNMLPAAPSR